MSNMDTNSFLAVSSELFSLINIIDHSELKQVEMVETN